MMIEVELEKTTLTKSEQISWNSIVSNLKKHYGYFNGEREFPLSFDGITITDIKGSGVVVQTKSEFDKIIAEAHVVSEFGLSDVCTLPLEPTR